jgi:hypothetical protein
MVNLDYRYPILFLPIRIETKYAKRIVDTRRRQKKRFLRIRFFPDQISIDNFDPRLTKQEVQDATTYWNKIKDIFTLQSRFRRDFEKVRDMAWQQLVNKYNCERAAYISKAVIHYDPSSDPDPKNPTFRPINAIPIREEGQHQTAVWKLLPTRFIVYGKFKKEGLPPLDLEVSSKNVTTDPTDLDLFSKQDDDNNTSDPDQFRIQKLGLLSDFNTAKQN